MLSSELTGRAMTRGKKDKEFLTVDDIRGLFKKHWGISVVRQGVYYYVAHKGFPDSTKRGRPRLWDKEKVDQFFKNNA